jgi:hypothetical protein
MDGQHFDSLLKHLAVARSSRAQALRGLAAGVLGAASGAVLAVEEAAAKKNKKKKNKKKRICDCASSDVATCVSLRKKKKKANRTLRNNPCAYPGRCTGVSGCPPPETTTSGPTCLQPVANDPDGTEGLQTAIDTASAGDTLVLCAGRWHLTKTVEIAKNMTVLGAGDEQTILDGGNAVRVLQIGEFGSAAPLTVTVQDLQITKGKAANGIYPDNTGGGIFNEGTLTLIGSRVTGNSATFAGGIYNSPNDRLTLEAGSNVTGNSAGDDGGGIWNAGQLTLEAGSNMMGNSAGRWGGGIFNGSGGTVTLKAGSTVGGEAEEDTNTAGTQGGGIFNSGTVTLAADSRVENNTADNAGGGIYNSVGTVTLDPGSIVTDNTPDNCEPDIGTCT